MEHSEIIQQLELLKQEIEELKQSVVPIGTIGAFAMEKVPKGWLICDGKEYRIELFQELFDTIGTTFTPEETTLGFFCVPDLQGRFIRGWDMEGNVDPERELGDYQEDAIQGHSHKVYIDKTLKTDSSGEHHHKVYYHSHAITNGAFSSYTVFEVSYSDSDFSYSDSGKGTTSEGSHTHNMRLKIDAGTSGAVSSNYGKVKADNENRPKNIALLYCIKAK
ncbi:MAG: tail fiber protein [Bacteroidales bacterium]|nr:tail fiber protein [Bacteroidales bacterium]